MTEMYEKLAGLLRRLAEAEPERFFVNAGGIFGGGPFIWNKYLGDLEDSYYFSQDDMDAICGAVGMWFQVGTSRNHLPMRWGFDGFKIGKDYEEGACELSNYYEDEIFDKRTASVAATIACLEYALNARLERKGRE